MPEFKERPKSGRQKAMRPGTALPKQAIRQLKEKYIKELEKSPEEPQNPGSRATDQVEQAGRWAVKELAGAAAPARRLWKQKKSPHHERISSCRKNLPIMKGLSDLSIDA